MEPESFQEQQHGQPQLQSSGKQVNAFQKYIRGWKDYYITTYRIVTELLTHWHDPEWSKWRIVSVFFVIALLNCTPILLVLFILWEASK